MPSKCLRRVGKLSIMSRQANIERIRRNFLERRDVHRVNASFESNHSRHFSPSSIELHTCTSISLQLVGMSIA